MSNFHDSDPILWESEEFICFLLVLFIQVYNTIRDNRPILTRSAILQPTLAPWDGSFLTMTGFSRPAFMALESILKLPPPPFNVGGRPPKLNFRAQLGLFLMWTCSRMRLKDLCLLFGCVPSSAHYYLKKFLSCTASVLRKHTDARIMFTKFPSKICILPLRSFTRYSMILFRSSFPVLRTERLNCLYNIEQFVTLIIWMARRATSASTTLRRRWSFRLTLTFLRRSSWHQKLKFCTTNKRKIAKKEV